MVPVSVPPLKLTGFVNYRADTEVGNETLDSGQGREQLAVDPLIAIALANLDLQQIIRLAGHQMGFGNLVGLDLLFDTCAEAGSTLVFVSHDRQLAHSFDRDIALPDINGVRPVS